MQIQYRRRRPRHLSKRDRNSLALLLVGLVFFSISWVCFHRKFLADIGGRAKTGATHSSSGKTSSSISSAKPSDALSKQDTERQQGIATEPPADGAGGGGSFCERHFGLAWVRAWNATRRQVCSPPIAGTEAFEALPRSSITCGSPDPDDHLPPASAPHVLCDATNLWLDPSKLSKARCPKHRPGYLCISRTYHHYAPGAWQANCEWPGFDPAAFSKDHMQDIFAGMIFGAEGLPPAHKVAVEEMPTLFVTREIHEHANVFHTLTDLLNVYVTLLLLGWEQAPRQVVVLDAHKRASLDMLWPLAAAGGGQAVLTQALEDPWQAQLDGRRLVRRVAEFEGPVLFRRAAFVPPGYTSLLFAHLYEPASCAQPTQLFQGFRKFLLEPFGIRAAAAAAAATGHSSAPLVVRLVSRRPGKAKRKMARQISNEDELLAALRRAAASFAAAAAAKSSSGGGSSSMAAVANVGVDVGKLDLSELPLPEQLQAVASTDVLVAMHGAALAFSLLMPPHAAVVELWPQREGIWRCYEHFSHWGGLLYRRLANEDPAKHVKTKSGDATEVDAAALANILGELLPAVAERRARVLAAGGGALGGQEPAGRGPEG